jgi:GT2 family glycosyltransferase
MKIGAVAIGRNEGERLVRCLTSLQGKADPIVYVDSGSSDGSVDAAKALGALVVELDTTVPFTAARARNAGAAALLEHAPDADAIQFVDGDCEVRDGWIATARDFLLSHPQAAVACGRRRERAPEDSLWNRLIDREWDTPVGRANACGGDALVRVAPFKAVGGFNPTLIAGEEPELCVRLRLESWEIWRLDHEMTWHDAALTRFGQWWQRARRAGHAFAEGAALHGRGPTGHNMAAVKRILIWGFALPCVVLLGLTISPVVLLLLTLYPIQIMRLSVQQGDRAAAAFLVLAKFPEFHGMVDFVIGRLQGRQRKLIEYK